MSDVIGDGYGRNFDGKPDDVLQRLQMVLSVTPPHALSTTPLRRALLEAVVTEIVRLRRQSSAVPVDAIHRLIYGRWDYAGWDVDQSDVVKWLSADAAQKGR
jgi:hypothetical protein